ncbi:type II toxin-antitoxin system VapC family toxin [Bdellovibrionota bacterium FG-2]
MGRRVTSRKKPTVYIETTIPSYLTSRFSTDLEKYYRQVKTREWWDKVFPKIDAVISDYVLDEARDGDPDAASKRLEVLRGIKILDKTDEITTLARELQIKLKIPPRARVDAFHLAFSVIYQVEYVLSWNFEHIVGAPVKRTFAEIGKEFNLVMPTLCTPEELMEV